MTRITTVEPIEFTVGEQTYSLKMGFTALVRMEKEFDRPSDQIFSEVFGSQMRMADLLAVFWSCMLGATPGGTEIEDVTRDEAAELIDQLGIERVGDLIRQAAEACPLFREPEKPKPKVRGAGPAKKKAA